LGLALPTVHLRKGGERFVLGKDSVVMFRLC
jgi:hypothetical protein